jgi:hypothetical protein
MQGMRNLEHAREGLGLCNDPDCEIHNPEVIEPTNERLTALAWFLAGADWGQLIIENTIGDVHHTFRDELNNRMRQEANYE